MKTTRFKPIAILLVLIMLGLTACGGQTAQTESETKPAETQSETETSAQTANQNEATESAQTQEESQTETSAEPEVEAAVLTPGYYEIYEVPDQISHEEIEEMAAKEQYMFIVIEEGGTGYEHVCGTETELTWDEKNITISYTTYPYVVDDDVVTISYGGKPHMILHRSDKEAPARGETVKAAIGLTRTDEIILGEEVLLDNEDFTLVVNGITPPEAQYEDYVINMTVTNRIDDNLGFSVQHVVINGITIDLTYSADGCTASPGETRTFDLPIRVSELKQAGIGDPTQIDLYMRIKPQYDANDKFLGYLTIYPLGADKAETTVREAAPTDQIIADNEQIKLTYIGLRDYSEIKFAYCMFWAENKTDEILSFTLYQFSVNGNDANLYESTVIAPGASGLVEVVMSYENLEAAGVHELSEIKDISFSADVRTEIKGDRVFEEALSVQP